MADLMAALEEALGIAEQDRLYGVGAPQVAVVAQPAIGSNWSIQLSTIRAVRLSIVHGRLITSAVVGNRYPILTVTDQGGNVVAEYPFAAPQAASVGAHYTWGRGLTSVNMANTYLSTPIVGAWLPPGSTVSVATQNIDAGDQWLATTILYELR